MVRRYGEHVANLEPCAENPPDPFPPEPPLPAPPPIPPQPSPPLPPDARLRLPPPLTVDAGDGSPVRPEPAVAESRCWGSPTRARMQRPPPERGPGPAIRWWRGWDLNPRPSGYEPDELPDCSTPRRSGRSSGWVAARSRPVCSRRQVRADRLRPGHGSVRRQAWRQRSSEAAGSTAPLEDVWSVGGVGTRPKRGVYTSDFVKPPARSPDRRTTSSASTRAKAYRQFHVHSPTSPTMSRSPGAGRKATPSFTQFTGRPAPRRRAARCRARVGAASRVDGRRDRTHDGDRSPGELGELGHLYRNTAATRAAAACARLTQEDRP